MPLQSSNSSKDQENSSGIVRDGKGYIIDGEAVKGIMKRWKIYRPRIEAFEREVGYRFTKKGNRIPLKLIERHNKRDAEEAELPAEPDEQQAESETESGSHDEAEETPKEEVETKKKTPPKQKKKPAKRPRVKSAA